MDKKEIKYDVSVIIVTYNTFTLTSDCIKSIIHNTKDISFEIILVDNASTDGSRDIFENDNRIKYIYNDINSGFGTANNIGFKSAAGKYIFLLNSDTLLLNNAIKIFYDKMEILPKNVACCGAWLMDSEKNIIHSGDYFPKWYQSFFGNKKELNYSDSTKDLSVDYVTGADLFIRRSAIEKYGLFDENIFLYYEETDLQERYHQHGLQSMIINGPQIVHLEGKSSKPSVKKGNIMMNSKIYYFKKRMNPIWFCIWKNLVLVKRSIHLLIIK